MKTEFPERDKNNQDIDLMVLFKLIQKGLDKIGYKIYRFFRFIIKNIFVILGVIALGILVGYFLNANQKQTYQHQLVVTPNFGSVTFLYNEVDKFKSNNSSIKSVKIEPIVNIYEFSKERWANLELMKYLDLQDININKYTEKSNVEKFYRYHLLTLISDEKDLNGSVITTFLNKVNTNPYFLERQKVEIKNISSQILETEITIQNINKILNALGTPEEKSTGVNVSSYPELHQLINTKKNMFDDLSNLKVYQIENSKVIYTTSKISNIKIDKINKVILTPIIFLFIYFFIYILISFYKKYNKIQHQSIIE